MRAEEAQRWGSIPSTSSPKAKYDPKAKYGPRVETGLTHESSPLQFFNTLIKPSKRSTWAKWSKAYGKKHDFGTKRYKADYTPAEKQDVDNMIASYILNGLHSYPNMLIYFENNSFAYNDSTVRQLWRTRDHFKSFKGISTNKSKISHFDNFSLKYFFTLFKFLWSFFLLQTTINVAKKIINSAAPKEIYGQDD